MRLNHWLSGLFPRYRFNNTAARRRLQRRRSAARHLGTTSAMVSHVESLEDRVLLAATVIEVTTTADTIASDSVTSLREAVIAANADTNPDGVEIHLASANYVLNKTGANENNAESGDLDIRKTSGNIKIVGTGSTTINGNSTDRIFEVFYGASLTVQGVTLTGGYAYDNHGGAIYNTGTVNVTDSTLSGNTAIYYGGGIYNTGTVNVTDSTLSGNTAGQFGGGILNESNSTAIVTRSTLSGNTANSSGGGGIYTNGQLTIVDSNIHNNTAGWGGGLQNGYGNIVVVNSTISHNAANGTYGGGGIFNTNAGTGVVVSHSTITQNRDFTGAGGGILNYSGYPLTLDHTIVAGNYAGVSGTTASDVGGLLTGTNAYNLIGDAATAGGLANGPNGNIVGVNWTTVLDPNLTDNGGPTLTHALLEGSAAINAGDPGFNNPAIPYDQRGEGFNRVVGSRIDIGAFEFGAGNLTLQQQVDAAEPGDTLTFDIADDTALAAFLDELKEVTNVQSGSPITIQINLAAGQYDGQVAHVNSGLKLILNANHNNVTFNQGSPALTVDAGQVEVRDGLTFDVLDDFETIRVKSGGSLTLTNVTVRESLNNDQSAIVVESGGVLDLSSGDNILDVRDEGQLITWGNATNLEIIGNTLQLNGVNVDTSILANSFAIEDRITHALDSSGGTGLVTWVADTLFVTQNSGSIQRAANAASTGNTIHVAAGTFVHSGQMDINTSVTIIGAGQDDTIIQSAGQATGTEVRTVQVNAPNVTFQNLTFGGWVDAPSDANVGNGYLVWNVADHTTFDDVHFTGDDIRVAIYTGTSNYLTVTDSLFTGTYFRAGIRGAGEHMLISGNSFEESHYWYSPIYFEYGAATSGEISYNYFASRVGVNNQVHGDFKSDGTGLYAITNFQPNKTTSDGLLISHNTFHFQDSDKINQAGSQPIPTAIYIDPLLPASGPITISDNIFQGYQYTGPQASTDPLWHPGEGVFGGALEFSGNGQFGVFEDAAFDVGAKGTFALWIKLDTLGKRHMLAGGAVEYQVRHTNDPYFYPGNLGNDNTLIWSSDTFAVDEWTHVAYTWDHDTQEGHIYLDGIEVNYRATYGPDVNPAWTTVQNTVNKLIYLGRDPNVPGPGTGSAGGRDFDGMMDDVAWFDDVLSVVDIQTIRDSGVASLGADPRLVAHWDFDQSSGNIAIDNVNGIQLHLVTDGVVPFSVPEFQPSAGHFGGALEFDGVDSLATFSDPGFDIGTNGSIAVWIKLDQTGKRHTVSHGAFEFQIDESNRIYFYGNKANGDNALFRTNSLTGLLTAGTWIHIAATWDFATQTGRIYLNGVEAPTGYTHGPVRTGWVTPNSTAGQVLYVGEDPTTALRNFDGMMDDLAYYNKTLTPAEIAAIISNGVSADPNLVAYWNFDDAQGTTVVPGDAGTSINLYLQSTPPSTPVQGYAINASATTSVTNNLFYNNDVDFNSIVTDDGDNLYGPPVFNLGTVPNEHPYQIGFGSLAAYASSEFKLDSFTDSPHIGAYQGDPGLFGTGDLVVNGSTGDDLLVLDITGENAGTLTYTRDLGGLNEVTITPVVLSNITGLIFNGGLGDDRLVINNPLGSVFAPINGIVFNGGDGGENTPGGNPDGDALEIIGGSATTVEHVLISEGAGEVRYNGTLAITYTGLEPIIDTIDATNRIFTFTGNAGDEAITLSDDLSIGDGLSLIDSNQGESVTFLSPTGKLVINTAGNGNDTLSILGLDSLFNAHLEINAGSGAGDADVVEFNGLLSLQNDKNLTVTKAETIEVTGSAATSGTGAISFTADRNIVVDGGRLTTASGSLGLNANTSGTFAGTFVGIELTNAAAVSTTAGAIALNGTGGNSGSDNHGVRVTGAGTTLSSVSGSVTLTGQGNGAAGDGVWVDSAAMVQTTGTGSIAFSGNDAGAGVGVRIDGTVQATATGTVVIESDDEVVIGASGTVSSNSTLNTNNARAIRITADQGAGNNGGAISIASGGKVEAEGRILLEADGDITVSGVVSGLTINGQIHATSTSGAILDAGSGNPSMSSLLVNLTANSIGTVDQSLNTATQRLVTNTAAAGGDQWINELDNLTLVDMNAGAGNISLQTGSHLRDSDGIVDITANHLTLNVGGTGTVGVVTAPVMTTINSLSGTSAGTVYLVNQGDLTVNDFSVTQANRQLHLSTTGGSLNVSGNVSATNSVNLTSERNVTLAGTSTVTGSVVNVVGGADDSAATIRLNGTVNSTAQGTVTGGAGDDRIIVNAADGQAIDWLKLDGGAGNDTYEVWLHGLDGSIDIEDSSSSTGDVAEVHGTDADDVIWISNKPTPNTGGTVTLGANQVTYSTSLESLIVDGGLGNDLFHVQPSLSATITIDGNDPGFGDAGAPGGDPSGPGDVLDLDPLDNTFEIIGNSIQVHGEAFNRINFRRIEGLPLDPIGGVGEEPLKFDFDAGVAMATQSGYTSVSRTQIYGVDGATFGWEATPAISLDRNKIGGWALGDLTRDFHGDSVARTFTADVGSDDGWYLVTVTMGDRNLARDKMRVTNALNNEQILLDNVNTAPGQFIRETFAVQAVGGKLSLTFSDHGGNSQWVVNSLEIYPGELLTMGVRESDIRDGGPYVADGLTEHQFEVVNVTGPAGGLITITAGLDNRYSNDGLIDNAVVILTPDAAPEIDGIQIAPDVNGKYFVTIQSPTGSGTVYFNMTSLLGDQTGLASIDFTAPTVRRFDFNTTTSPIQTPSASAADPGGYTSVLPNTLYTPGSGYGWQTTVTGLDRGNLPGTEPQEELRRDFHYGNSVNTFTVELKPGTYWVNVTMGDRNLARNDMKIYVNDDSDPTLTVTTAVGEYFTGMFLAEVGADGLLRLKFQNGGGSSQWVINGLDIREVNEVLGVTFAVEGGSTSVEADGTSVRTIVGTATGVAPGTWMTVSTTLGTIVSADGASQIVGHQVQVGIDGKFSFVVQAPFVITGVPTFTAMALDGTAIGTQNNVLEFVGAAGYKFDFNYTNSPTQDGYVGMLRTKLYDADSGYGWEGSAPPSHVNRTVPNSPEKSLLQDGHTGTRAASRVFRLDLEGGATYTVVVIMGDTTAYDNMFIGNANSPGQMFVENINTAAGEFKKITFTVTLAPGEDNLRLEFGDATGGSHNGWIVNSVSVLKTDPSALTSSESQGTGGSSVTVSQVQATLNRAIELMVASGFDLSLFAGVQVQIVDFGNEATLGMAGANLILIDNDAFGHGWFIDPTLADNNEFVFSGDEGVADLSSIAYGKVDLLTVLMHELGRLAGENVVGDPNDLMTETLGTGIRRLPSF